MARVTPKTNWTGSNVPIAPDFNRMEGNAQQAFDELDAEVQNRIDDVNAEESRAISAENAEYARATAVEAAFKSLDGIGSYAFLAGTYASLGGDLSPGSTLSDVETKLWYAGFQQDSSNIPNILVYTSSRPSGTWLCMGYLNTNQSFPSLPSVTSFVKIS